MPIQISSDRYEKIIAAIDYAHHDTNANARARLQLQWLNLTVTETKMPTRDEHLVDILAYVLTQPNHVTPQMAIYLTVYMNYHQQVKIIELSGRFIEDLNHLIDLGMITQKDQEVALTTLDHRLTTKIALQYATHSYSDSHIQSLLQRHPVASSQSCATTPTQSSNTPNDSTNELKQNYDALFKKYTELQNQTLQLQSNLLTHGPRSASIASTATHDSIDDFFSLSPELQSPPSPPRPF